MADPSTAWEETEAVADAEAYVHDQANAAYYETGGYEAYDQQQAWGPAQCYEGDASGEQADAAYENDGYDYNVGYDTSAGYDYSAGNEYGADGQALSVGWDDPNAYADAYGVEGEASYFALEEADPNAPTSPFGDEAYWQQYGEAEPEAVAYQQEGEEYSQEGEDAVADLETNATTANGDGFDANASVPADESGPATATSIAAPLSSDNTLSTPPPSSSSSTKRKKKPKTKQERMQMRQQQLEKEEEDAPTDAMQPPDGVSTPGIGTAKTAKVAAKQRAEAVPLSFLDRERVKLRLRLRQARAIARKRMPIQIRILTETRKNLSPMEVYFGGSVETALSDIFWAATKGDLRRVKFLVEVEKVSVTDCLFDPWQMEQTPMHWAAKGGSGAVIEYFLQAGANARALDETGSMPLHLACWAGHIDATLALLRATDTKDLYIRDYDAALAPLDWANIRGHTKLVKAIEKYEDSKWLPKFVEDLIRGIIRYKIKLFKEPPRGAKSPTRGINFRRPGGTTKAASTAGATTANNTADNQANTAADAETLVPPTLTEPKAETRPETQTQTQTTTKSN